MPESFKPIGQTHDYKKHKNTKPNAWEPALWAMLVGSASVTTIDIMMTVPNWLDIVALAATTTIACASAYKMYKSVKATNKYIDNQKQH